MPTSLAFRRSESTRRTACWLRRTWWTASWVSPDTTRCTDTAVQCRTTTATAALFCPLASDQWCQNASPLSVLIASNTDYIELCRDWLSPCGPRYLTDLHVSWTGRCRYKIAKRLLLFEWGFKGVFHCTENRDWNRQSMFHNAENHDWNRVWNLHGTNTAISM